MNILVTGCAGFIGFHMAKRLISEGHQVVGVDNINGYYSVSLKLDRLKELGITATGIKEHVPVRACNGFTFIKSDIEDNSLFWNDLKNFRFDAVCHLAAQAGVRYSIDYPEKYISSNIVGFLNVLEFCRRRPETRLVFASSSSVYGKNTSIPYKESDMTDSPVSLYAATKKSNELMAYSYTELYGFEAIGLRFFTVYGPWGRPDMAPFLFTKALLDNEEVKLFNNGDMSRDFTYIDDIIEGVHRTLLDAPATKESRAKRFRIYNIGNSKPVNLGDFISTVEKSTGRSAKRVYLPMQPGDVKATWADTTRLRDDYGYSPETGLTEGLAAFTDWYLDYYKK